MAKGAYAGIGGTAHKIKKTYLGINGVARKVKKIYIGVNGVARLAWQGTVPAGQVIFTSSQVWTVPDGVRKVDIFCVGGGGGGYLGSSYSSGGASGAGGGSGYTKTVLNADVSSGAQYSVTVGTGGNSNAYWPTVSAGTSSFGSLCSASGGYQGFAGVSTFDYGRNYSNGGSAGGNGAFNHNAQYVGETYTDMPVANGASDGGSSSQKGRYNDEYNITKTIPGQGTTTRAFSESYGTLYAGGGGGGAACFSTSGGIGGAGGGGNGGGGGSDSLGKNGDPGIPNTGGGGGGGQPPFYVSGVSGSGGAGGAGIVIVRWAEQ